ncbi:MAG: response regulator transcription factor [Deltaproteobacteria bacterium]|nr:response regulator transcription factor [Deltaproteobacteria bacterium]
MNIESNLAANATITSGDVSAPAELPPVDSLIAFAPASQVPIQLEHWLRKRQVALEVVESATLDIEKIKSTGARFVLVDLDTQGRDADSVRKLRAELPSVRFVVMTSNGDPKFLQSLNEAGASGVILKRAYVADLALAIQAATDGKSYVSGIPSQRDGSQIQITARERQVLELMANGFSNQAIGEKLSISVKTVEAHRARLFKKLGASNVADAVLLAIRVGLVMP